MLMTEKIKRKELQRNELNAIFGGQNDFAISIIEDPPIDDPLDG